MSGEMRALLVFLSTVLALVAGTTVPMAQEPARLALLIGNKGYTAKVGALKNPHNDVDLVEASLKRLGFKVTVLKDATYKQMDTALKRYVADVRRAGKGALSFFYYSGHGVSNPENGLNYLIPVDVADADDDKVWEESFQQNYLIDLLAKQATAATHYLVFDACRNELNVSGPNAKALGSDKGFVPLADTSGLLIAYATAPKRTASDVGDGGGPYARVLAEELIKPGVETVTMFRNVQIKVKQSIGQDPWLSFPSLPEVYLAGKVIPEVALPPVAESEAERVWKHQQLDREPDRQLLESFAKQYAAREPFWARKAEDRIAAMDAANVELQAANARVQAEQQAKDRAADAAAWMVAKQTHDRDAYRHYIKAWPAGEHRDTAFEAIRSLEREFGTWAALKSRRSVAELERFRASATSAELIAEANARIKVLVEDETTAWELANQSRRLADYTAFLTQWPDGHHADEAREWEARLIAIRARWNEIKSSDNDGDLDIFVNEHGWSEFGADAAVRLVALRKETGKNKQRARSEAVALTANELRDLLKAGTLRMRFSDAEVTLHKIPEPAYRVRLGPGFLAKLLPEKVLVESAFRTRAGADERNLVREGLGAVVISQVDSTGSLFLMQMHGEEKTKKDVDSKDRQFMTLQVLRTRHGLVCVGTKWQSLLETKDPDRYAEGCAVR